MNRSRIASLLGIAMAFAGGVILTGCGIDRTATLNPPVLWGDYTGAAERGPAVSFSFKKGEGGIMGRGRIEDQDVLFIQDSKRSVPGRLVFGDGTVLPTTLEMKSSGTLSLHLPGGNRKLVPSTNLALPPMGPHTGFFEAEDKESPLGALDLVQIGKTLVGTAGFLGCRAGFTAWMLDESHFYGTLVFEDESELLFDGLINEKGNLVLMGFGYPFELSR